MCFVVINQVFVWPVILRCIPWARIRTLLSAFHPRSSAQSAANQWLAISPCLPPIEVGSVSRFPFHETQSCRAHRSSAKGLFGGDGGIVCLCGPRAFTQEPGGEGRGPAD